MDEEGSNLGGVLSRIQQGSLAACPLVAAVESFSFAPAAAPYDERSCAKCTRGRVARDYT
jgi:hypothetical protein